MPTFDEELLSQLRNVHTYAATPFRESNLGEIDLDGFRSNIEFLIQRGMQVIAVGGGTGEIETLSPDELESLAQTALEVADDCALVIPCLPPNYAEAITLVQRYEAIGAQMAMSVPPLIRWKVPADLLGVRDYYQQLAQVTSLPLMPYNTQGWPAEFFVQLAEIDSIVGIKDPCQVPHEFFRAIQLLGDRFVWVGNKRHDPGVAHLRYQMGMQGFTSGQSNFWPEPELQIHEAALKQDWPTVIAIQQRVAPLERLRLENDDAAMVKAAMDLAGLAGGKVRPPRRDLSEAGHSALKKAFVELQILQSLPKG